MTSGPSAETRPRTLNDIFIKAINRRCDRLMMVREAINWVSISSEDFRRNVAGFARVLEKWGIAKGDRVAILSENRPEWPVADFATLLVGGVVVPIYTTLTDQQTLLLLRDSQARVVVVSTQEQLNKVQAIRDQSPIEQVVVMDAVQTGRAAHLQALVKAGEDFSETQLESRAALVQPDDLATIIYTSGTTGTSKGAMLTHGNMTSNICSLEGFEMHPDDVSISFLPLSHVTARHVDFALLYRGVTLAYCSFITQLPQALMEVQPTIIVAVPRVYEKIHSQVEQETKAFPKNEVYRWALSVGRAAKPEILSGKTPVSRRWQLANKLVFSKVHAGLGGRARIFISGGAPLGRELADWYATIGIRIHEGYGLTETSPVIAVNTPGAHKLGTVGKPLSNVEVRIAEDGEILVRGPSVFKGYWNKPDETASALMDGGWFKTGDIGGLDSDGFLFVTDRKKDLIKTSGGKFIAPQPIENSLKLNALVGAAIVLGDRRKFPAVIISPFFPLLEDWARNNDVAFNSRAELIAQPRVRSLYDGIVDDLNTSLARFERLKKVILVAEEFSPESGLLTPTMKLRRRAVEERYRSLIEQIYIEADK
jgi:long-chain acyl-CoA synthetase